METTNKYEINYCGKTYTITKNADGKFVMPDEIKKLNTSYGGAQMKPAVEVILIAMKPMTEKTFASQALANGKGITWLDDCRIPYSSDSDITSAGNRTATFGNQDTMSGGDGSGGFEMNKQGRFPANLLVSNDILDNGVVSKSTPFPEGYKQGIGNAKNTYDGANNSDFVITNKSGYNDKGQYSRYFDLDKWAEVNGIQPEHNTFPFLICPKAGKKEKNAGCEGLEEKEKPQRDDGQILINTPYKNRPGVAKNVHPTVKPIKLMSYLITLGSRPGDIVLDPFAGSGTTLCAAKKLNRRFIGCELSPEYVEIIKARLSAIK